MSSPHCVYQVICQSVDREARASPIPGRRGYAGELPSYLLVDLDSDGVQAASELPKGRDCCSTRQNHKVAELPSVLEHWSSQLAGMKNKQA